MYLHVAYDAIAHEPRVEVQFLPVASIVVEIERLGGACGDPECRGSHIPAYAIHIIENEDDPEDATPEDEDSPDGGIRMVMSTHHAAALIASASHFLAEHDPDLLAQALDGILSGSANS